MASNTAETTSKEIVGQSNLELEEEVVILEKRISELLQEDFSGKKLSDVADTLLEIERNLDRLGLSSQLADKAEELFEKMLIEMNPDGKDQIESSLQKLVIQEQEDIDKLQSLFKRSLKEVQGNKTNDIDIQEMSDFFDTEVNNINLEKTPSLVNTFLRIETKISSFEKGSDARRLGNRIFRDLIDRVLSESPENGKAIRESLVLHLGETTDKIEIGVLEKTIFDLGEVEVRLSVRAFFGDETNTENNKKANFLANNRNGYFLYNGLKDNGVNSLTDTQKDNIYQLINGDNNDYESSKALAIFSDISGELNYEDTISILNDRRLIDDIILNTEKYNYIIYPDGKFTSDYISLNYNTFKEIESYSDLGIMKIDFLKKSIINFLSLKESDKELSDMVANLTIEDSKDIDFLYKTIIAGFDNLSSSNAVSSLLGILNGKFQNYDKEKYDIMIFNKVTGLDGNSSIVSYISEGDQIKNLKLLLGVLSLSQIKKLNELGDNIQNNPSLAFDSIKNLDLDFYSKKAVDLSISILNKSIEQTTISDKEKLKLQDFVEVALQGERIKKKELRLVDDNIETAIFGLLNREINWEEGDIVKIKFKEAYKEAYDKFIGNQDSTEEDFVEYFISNIKNIKTLSDSDTRKLLELLDVDRMNTDDRLEFKNLLLSGIDKKELEIKWEKLESIYEYMTDNDVWNNQLSVEEKIALICKIPENFTTLDKEKQKSLVATELFKVKIITFYRQLEPIEFSLEYRSGLLFLQEANTIEELNNFMLTSKFIEDKNGYKTMANYSFYQKNIDALVNSLVKTHSQVKENEELASSYFDKNYSSLSKSPKTNIYHQNKEDQENYLLKVFSGSYNEQIVDSGYLVDIRQKEEKQYSPSTDTSIVDMQQREEGYIGYENQTTQTSEEGMSISSTEDENGLYITNFTIPEEYTASGDATTMEIKSTSHVETSQKILENYVTEILGLDIDLKGTLDSFVKATGIQISDQHPIGLEEIGQFNIFMQAFMIKYVDRTTIEMNNLDYNDFLEDLIYRPTEVLPIIGKLIKRGENVLSDSLEYKDQAYRFNFIGKEPIHNLEAKEVIRDAMKEAAVS